MSDTAKGRRYLSSGLDGNSGWGTVWGRRDADKLVCSLSFKNHESMFQMLKFTSRMMEPMTVLK
jgi:hypothetical protein